jgi:hypothetical protein
MRAVATVAVVAIMAVAVALILPPGGASAGGGGASALAFVGRFHILALHLPIGALVAAVSVEGWATIRGARARVQTAAALDALVPFLFGTAAVAFVLGVLLAREGGHPAHLLALHRGTTLAALVTCASASIAWVWARDGQAPAGFRAGFRALLALTAVLMSAGAHFGGSLTHGESFLVEAAPAGLRALLGGGGRGRGNARSEGPNEAAASPVVSPGAAAASDPKVLADVIVPLLREHCLDCHGEKKSKGRLRLDSLDAIRAGGKHGPVMVPGDGAKSALVSRMRLPESDDERMPPSDRKAPPPEMADLLALWIDRGASPELRVKDLVVPEGPRRLLERALTPGASAPAPGPLAPPPPEAVSPPPEAISPSPRADEAGAPQRDRLATTGLAQAGVAPVFASHVLPLLDRRCGTCHARGKSKGGLRTDSLAALATGGDSGPAVMPGSPGTGTLLARLRLPLDEKEHMPPRSHPQLAPGELALLTWWVGQGAPERSATVPTFASAPAAAKASPAADVATNAPSTPSAMTGARLFREVVAPMLAKRCGACHAGAEPSSGTRFDDASLLLTKGHVLPGHADASPLVQRVRLPAKDPDHMPPTDSPQPTAAEIAALGAWIDGGAKLEDDPATSTPTSTPTAAAALAPAPATPTPADPSAPRAAAALRVAPGSAGGCGACATVATPRAPQDLAAIACAGLALGSAVARR